MAVARFLARERIDGPIVVAVSGGPDSVALLHALAEARGWHAFAVQVSQGPQAEPGGGRESMPPRGDAVDPGHEVALIVAHFNHRLRGDESDGDEAFVRQLGAARFSQCRLHCGNAGLPETRGENAARIRRYEWLTALARQAGARFVATGHTADDQAETVLHRLLRGTGLRGLCGIPARRMLADGIEVIRPLLAVSRSDILSYLAALGQDYRTDRSNANRTHTRNRIRHELLPHLAEQYNPAVASALCRLARLASEAYQEREAQARALLAEAELPRAGSLLVFDRVRLRGAPRAVVREALRQVWERESWPAGEMGHADWERAAGVAQGEAAAVDLPGGLRVRLNAHVVQVGRA